MTWSVWRMKDIFVHCEMTERDKQTERGRERGRERGSESGEERVGEERGKGGLIVDT